MMVRWKMRVGSGDTLDLCLLQPVRSKRLSEVKRRRDTVLYRILRDEQAYLGKGRLPG